MNCMGAAEVVHHPFTRYKMFILTEKPSFTAPVVFHIPADGGKTQKVEFSVVFRFLPADEVKDLFRRLDAQKLLTAARQKRHELDPESALQGERDQDEITDRDIIDRVLIGFGDDLKGEDRKPLDFTPDNLERLLRVHGAQQAIVESFFKHHFKAPEKN